jgi:TRAP-type uncharacterized transport system substrate-binding protein
MTGLTINAHPMASVLVARTDLTDDQAYALAEMSERVRAQISTVYPLAGLPHLQTQEADRMLPVHPGAQRYIDRNEPGLL